MIKKVSACIVGMLMLAGCSVTQPNQAALVAHAKTEEARQVCYKTMAESNKAFYNSIAKLPKDKQTLVLLLKQQGDTLRTVVAGIKGTSMDPCRATNLFDAEIAEVKSKNDAVKAAIPVVGSVATTGIATYGIVEFGKTAIRGAGDEVTIDHKSSMEGSMQRTSVENHAISTSGSPVATGSSRDTKHEENNDATEEMPKE